MVFEPGDDSDHVTYTDVRDVWDVTENSVGFSVSANGSFTLQFNDGATQRVTIDDMPSPFHISGPWTVILESEYFPRVEQTMDALTSWTNDPVTRHFSGTGVYTLDFDLPAVYVDDDMRLFLDLGDVGNVAEVYVNGNEVGIAWLRGQELDVTEVVHAGANRIEVRVTNTLINRVAGMTGPPPVPEELRERLGAGVNDTRQAMARLIGFAPLPRSGLLGPVVIRPLKHVHTPR
jgi:hypothetical protein